MLAYCAPIVKQAAREQRQPSAESRKPDTEAPNRSPNAKADTSEPTADRRSEAAVSDESLPSELAGAALLLREITGDDPTPDQLAAMQTQAALADAAARAAWIHCAHYSQPGQRACEWQRRRSAGKGLARETSGRHGASETEKEPQ